MKRTIFSVLTATVISCSVLAADTIRLSDPVAKSDVSETFGQVLNLKTPEVSLQAILQAPQEWANKQIRLQTPIVKVCQKKGCFFVAQSGENVIRIAFKDYGFFIPTDSAGKTVWLTGQLVKKVRDAAQAEHFNQDLADSASKLAVGDVYEIIADSVQIPI